MSTRGDILSNLYAALESIAVVNGYSSDVAQVYRRPFGQEEVTHSKSPVLAVVYDGAEQPRGRVGAKWRMAWPVTIEGIIRKQGGAHEAAELSDQFNGLIADLRRCLHAANLGNNVLYLRLGEVTPFHGEDLVFFSQQTEILYFYDEAAP